MFAPQVVAGRMRFGRGGVGYRRYMNAPDAAGDDRIDDRIDEKIDEKIRDLEAEDRHVTEVIEAARRRVTSEDRQTFADDGTIELEDDGTVDVDDEDHDISPA